MQKRVFSAVDMQWHIHT